MDIFSNDIFSLIYIIPGYVLVATFRYFNRSTKIGQFSLIVLSLFWGMVVFFGSAATFGWWLLNFVGSIQIQGLLGVLLQALILSVVVSIPAGFFGAWLARTNFFQKAQQLCIDALDTRRLLGFCLLVMYVTVLVLLALTWGIWSGRT